MYIQKILLVVTGTGTYANSGLATGLWLSEFTHIYHCAINQGYEVIIATPNGGNAPVDPESLKPLVLDKLSRTYWNNQDFRNKLQHTRSLAEASDQDFCCIYLAGGHGTMYDFPHQPDLQALLKNYYEADKTVAAICHGVCGLLNVRLTQGEYLIQGKRLTGYSWLEESVARRKKVVPFNLEEALKKRGARYEKAWIPMTSKVVVTGNLITGENPFSSKEMAKVVMQHLNEKNNNSQ